MRTVVNILASTAASLLVAFVLFRFLFDRPIPTFFLFCSGVLGLVIGSIASDVNREKGSVGSVVHGEDVESQEEQISSVI